MVQLISYLCDNFFTLAILHMRRQNTIVILSWVSLGLIFLAVMLTGFSLIRYSQMRSNYPLDLTIGDIPVGGLNSTEAAERLIRAYGIPIELVYGDSVIQVSPTSIGFSLNLETMLAAADIQRIRRGFWEDFWNYLWNSLPSPQPVPLSASVSEERLRDYLVNEIVPRYDQTAKAPVPVQGTVGFSQGESGRELDINRSIQLVQQALRSSNQRRVSLPFNRTSPPQASSISLEYMIRQILQQNEFDGIAEFYIQDMEHRNEISIAFSELQTIPTGVSFTAASTIKVPIMIYTYANRDIPLPESMQRSLQLMIEISENSPADSLLQAISGNLAPNVFTEDLKNLGYSNTFLGGLFYTGAPLLTRHKTAANSRTDVNTEPDAYNQTTAIDMGMMLDDLYLCSVYNGGSLKAYYGDRLTQEECTVMIEEMSKNKTAVLLEAGIPESVRVSHKHGWILEGDGLIHNISDAGIVYSPKATYVFVMFFYHPRQLVFDATNLMASQISNAVYQYFNQSSN